MVAASCADEAHRWIVGRRQGGVAVDDIVAALVENGWSPAQAARNVAVALGTADPTMVSDPPDDSPIPTWTPGRQRAIVTLRTPPLVVLERFLSPAECRALVDGARAGMEPAVTIQHGESLVHEARVSDNFRYVQGASPLLRRIEARISAAFAWPLERTESLQVVRYTPGGRYDPHYDYFDDDASAATGIGGQRVASLILYLQTPEAGGNTVFPDLGLEVAPVAGNALFFSYRHANPGSRTLHGGAPVEAGEKWICTTWLRRRT